MHTHKNYKKMVLKNAKENPKLQLKKKGWLIIYINQT